jgi:XTP/dITP diphosphohydrolase
MDRLRSPGGCPWDAEQTHESLVQYLVEETYETIEAIDSGDQDGLIEELGDLLLQVVFHARIGEESAQPFDIDVIAGAIADKLIARHPHVFGDETAETARWIPAWTDSSRSTMPVS